MTGKNIFSAARMCVAPEDLKGFSTDVEIE